MASTIKVDNVQNQPGTNIVSKCGTDVTLGASGDTVALASGASQTGFGREGSVDWQTGSIKTAGFTPTNGEGYFCDTSGGAFAVTLPAGVAGNIVAFADYTRTFVTYNLTITPNGSEKIGGVNDNAILDVSGQAAAFVYVDSTEGWINVQETQTSVAGVVSAYVVASGGNTTITSGDYKTHIFTGPGCFQVTCKGNDVGSETLEYVIAAGGGGGGTVRGGGAGAGGFRMYTTAPGCNSPLNNCAGITAAVTTYPIAVGGGGPGNGPYGPPTQPSTQAGAGSVSSGLGLTSAGGAFGGNNTPPSQMNGGDGGAGGGAGGQSGAFGGDGNTPPTSPAQGKDGGDDTRPGSPPGEGGAGGGGAAVAGANSVMGTAGGGGIGSYIADPLIGPTAPSYGEPGPVGSTRYFSGGGGGSGTTASGSGGVGGGGDGGTPGSRDGGAGVINTGGGGGGGAPQPTSGGLGGSGIVIIRYKFQ